MARIVRYRVLIGKQGEQRQEMLTGEFSQEVSDRLRDFVAFADELAETRFVLDGQLGSLAFGWNSTTGEYTATLPAKEVQAEFIHRLRPFLLEKEPTFFGRIRNILAREWAHPVLRARLDALKRLFSGDEYRRAGTLQISDTVVNSEDTLDAWLNALEYHRDVDKRAQMTSLSDALPADVLRVVFSATSCRRRTPSCSWRVC